MKRLHNVCRILKFFASGLEVVIGKIDEIIRKYRGMNGKLDINVFNPVVEVFGYRIMQLNTKDKAMRLNKIPASLNPCKCVTMREAHGA